MLPSFPTPLYRLFSLVFLAASLQAAPAPSAITDQPSALIDPTISHGIWEGWGTSLCWDGKAFGDRDDLADLLFTTKTVSILGQNLPGLGMNIVRYNAGACSWNDIDGHKMVTSKIIQPFRQMDGFWLDGKSDDPHSSSWSWNVDANQRAMLLKARDRGANHFELFSNSPMWWMCRNDNPSGAAKGNEDNLSPTSKKQFALYLATIAKYAKEHWGITFTSVEPFNEPSASYWNADGKQEGCHFSHQLQAEVLPLLREKLEGLGLTSIPIAASDETSYDQALATWQSFSPKTKSLAEKVNVHGYQLTGGNRAKLYDLVSKDNKVLWNSEYGEKDGTGLTLAHCLNLDFRYLHPTAWCYWQPFDNNGWGFVKTEMTTKHFQEVNPKYFVVAQYTRHIRPGMTILETGDTETVAAYDATAHKLVLVLQAEKAVQKSIDLGKFASISGPVTRWITEPKGSSRYEMHQDVKLSGKRLELSLPADSVQTIEIENALLP